MVLDYYNLQEQPFGVTPDSRYLFLNLLTRKHSHLSFTGLRRDAVLSR